MDKVISSPLTYWGGKRWLFKHLATLIPEGETEIFSPFIGGGSIEINLAARGYSVYAYDNHAPLVNFWQYYLKDPEGVRQGAYELLSLYTRDDLNRLRKNHRWDFDLLSAVLFIISNRFAFNGMWNANLLAYGLDVSGEYIRKPRRGNYGKNRLFSDFEFWTRKPLSKLNVKIADFEDVFGLHRHRFAYVDPPYFGNEKAYGGSSENGFDHNLLRDCVGNRKKIVISYNKHPRVYALYQDDFEIRTLNRCRRSSDGKQELLIFSHDLAENIRCI